MARPRALKIRAAASDDRSMRHPSLEPACPPEELRAEFLAREEQTRERLLARQRRNRRNGALAGGVAGLAAVLVTAGATRQAIAWHSFLLEALLGALAGYLLARWNGGVLKGLILFAGAYLFAFLLRAWGLDPGVLFAAGDLRAGAAVQGHFTSLCFLVSAGMAVGHILEE